MKYRNKKIKDAYTEELLFELLQRVVIVEAPRTRGFHGKWQEGIIGIGKDHIASICLPDEDLDVLRRIISELEE